MWTVRFLGDIWKVKNLDSQNLDTQNWVTAMVGGYNQQFYPRIYVQCMSICDLFYMY